MEYITKPKRVKVLLNSLDYHIQVEAKNGIVDVPPNFYFVQIDNDRYEVLDKEAFESHYEKVPVVATRDGFQKFENLNDMADKYERARKPIITWEKQPPVFAAPNPIDTRNPIC